jgi:hypothetical protein
MSTINELEQSFTDQADKTRVNYKNMYKRLRPLLKQDVKDSSSEEIIDAIKNYDTTATSRKSMLNVAIVIWRANKKDLKDFIKYRDELAGDSFDESKEKDQFIKSKGITIKTLTDFMNNAFINEDYVKYVINYLLLNFQVRNEDLDVIITTDKKQLNDVDNFIYVKQATADYIRNKYKTVDTYGKQKHLIRNKNFIEALYQILDRGKEGVAERKTDYLLKTGNKHVSVGYLNNYIAKNTYDNLGTSNYFKIMSTNKRNIEKMSMNRGTDPNTILHSYNLNKKVDLNKLKKKNTE